MLDRKFTAGRRATERDVATLARLRREFTLENGPIPSPREDFDSAFEKIVSSGLNDGRWTVWIADVEGEIVSHASSLPHGIQHPPRSGRSLR